MVQLGARDGDTGRRVERVKPIDELEADFRKRGAFLLVDVKSRKLWFYHYSNDLASVNQMIDSLKGRSQEMGNFLIERASVRVRPK